MYKTRIFMKENFKDLTIDIYSVDPKSGRKIKIYQGPQPNYRIKENIETKLELKAGIDFKHLDNIHTIPKFKNN